jgi:hypothetical protein
MNVLSCKHEMQFVNDAYPADIIRQVTTESGRSYNFLERLHYQKQLSACQDGVEISQGRREKEDYCSYNLGAVMSALFPKMPFFLGNFRHA